MINIKNLRQAGRSPVTRIGFVARPFFARIIGALARHEKRLDRYRSAIERNTATIQGNGSAIVSIQNSIDQVRAENAVAIQGNASMMVSLKAAIQGNGAAIVSIQNFIDQIRAENLENRTAQSGLKTDQIALAHRLASIEDATERTTSPSERTSLHALIGLQAQIDDIKTRLRNPVIGPSGALHTLPRNQAIAISGTSLVMHDGPYGRFLLRQPDLISDHILAGAFWDSHLKPIIERTGRSNLTAIDAGAYLGFHSVYMSRYFGRVLSFEPQLEIYRMLSANLLLNNCRNVIAFHRALYDAAGRMHLADASAQEIPLPTNGDDIDYDVVGNAAALAFTPASDGAQGSVEAMTIDEMALPELALLKVDTQGSDLRVLLGARATIERCRPVIATEFERELTKRHGHSLDDYYKFFAQAEYDVEVIDGKSDGKQIGLLASPR